MVELVNVILCARAEVDDSTALVYVLFHGRAGQAPIVCPSILVFNFSPRVLLGMSIGGMSVKGKSNTPPTAYPGVEVL